MLVLEYFAQVLAQSWLFMAVLCAGEPLLRFRQMVARKMERPSVDLEALEFTCRLFLFQVQFLVELNLR